MFLHGIQIYVIFLEMPILWNKSIEKTLNNLILEVCLFRYFPTKDMQNLPPTLQFWSCLYERCVMCWNEWKMNFPIFIFQVIVKVHRKLIISRTKMTKNDYNSKKNNRKNLKFDFPFCSADSGSFIPSPRLLLTIL